MTIMKKYENFNLIRKIDIQDYSGLETENIIAFQNFIEKEYPFKKRIEKFNRLENVFKEIITDIFRYILIEKFKE